MQIEPHEVPPTSVYKLITGCVVPRPIAWVSSVDAEGVPNLAPFSYFMAITDAPPTIAFSSGPSPRPVAEVGGKAPLGGKAPPRGKKDTLHNVETTGDFVVNVVDDALAEQMNLTSGDYPAEVDEFALARLTPAPSVKVKAPRIAEAPISLECRLVQVIPVGLHGLVLGEIVCFHLRDDLYDRATGRVDFERLRPVGRLAGTLYTHVHEIFEMKRPVV